MGYSGLSIGYYDTEDKLSWTLAETSLDLLDQWKCKPESDFSTG